MTTSKIEFTEGFPGDRAEALNPPATAGGCCGSAFAATNAHTSTCCGTAAEAQAEGSCCGSAAKNEAVATGAECCG